MGLLRNKISLLPFPASRRGYKPCLYINERKTRLKLQVLHLKLWSFDDPAAGQLAAKA